MKTVEQLAEEFDLINSEREQLVYEYNNEYLNAIEALCNAFMKDRLESLEPVAWFIWRFDGYKETKFYYNVNPLIDTATPLHDISSLKE